MADDFHSHNNAALLSLLANGAQTNADFDFGKINKSYWEGLDQSAKNDLRDAFKPTAANPNGVPMLPDGKSLDLPAIMKTLFQKGDIAGGVGLVGEAAGAADRSMLTNVGSPQGQPQQIQYQNVPSTNRGAPVTVAPALNKGGATPGGGGQLDPSGLGAQQDTQVTPLKFLLSQGVQPGYATEVALKRFKEYGINPNQIFDPNDPVIAEKVGPVIKAARNIGQVQPPQPGDNPPQGQPQPPQPGPQVAQAPPQAGPQVAQAPPPQAGQPTPQQIAAQNDPILKRLTFLAASPNKATAAAAETRLKSYLAGQEPTTEMKNAAASGMNLPQYQEKQGELAATQAGEVERAKTYVEKYNNINEAGDKAVSEIPKLHLALKQMDDPNYYSGPFNQYNLNGKRIVAALGGNPDKAAPQEIVNKITADSILNGMGALKGLGPIRVAEMKILGQASMSPDNSIEAQKFLANMAIRVQERVAKVSDIAQNYNDGVLDNGFNKKIRAEDRAHPLFSQPEIDRFQNILRGKEKAAPSPSSFGKSPEDQQAIRAELVKRGVLK